MTIPEACGLWIEQRIQEELEANPENPNLSAVGRQIAVEVEKHFEVRVNPDTIRKRASRSEAWTNVQGNDSSTNTGTKPIIKEIKQPKLAKDGTHRGGARPGAGRRPMPKDPVLPGKIYRHPLPDINDYVIEVAGDMDYLRAKMKKIPESMEYIKEKASLEILHDALKRLMPHLENAMKAFEGVCT